MKNIDFDYKPLTRDEMWKAKEIDLLEQILWILKSKDEPLQMLGELPGKSQIEEVIKTKKQRTKKVK
jgi:hypothetical protein